MLKVYSSKPKASLLMFTNINLEMTLILCTYNNFYEIKINVYI